HGCGGLGGPGIAPFGAAQQIVKTEAARVRPGLQVVAQSGAVGGEDLPAPTAAASANRSIGIQRNVAKLTGHSMHSAHEFSVGQNCSSISCSTIREIVLRCIPETRDRSAREMGCRVRMRFRTMRRLMSRTTSLEAPSFWFLRWPRKIAVLLPAIPADCSVSCW